MDRKAIVLLAALLMAALAACSTGSSPSRSSPPGSAHSGKNASTAAHHDASKDTDAGTASAGSCPADIAAQICVTVSITGAASVSGTGHAVAPVPASASPETTCKQLAMLNDGGERDLGDNVQNLGGHTVAWDKDLGNFHGPDRYDLSKSDFYVRVDDKSYNASRSTSSVTVRSDFSATYTFRGLSGDDGTISGSVSWTCVDPA